MPSSLIAVVDVFHNKNAGMNFTGFYEGNYFGGGETQGGEKPKAAKLTVSYFQTTIVTKKTRRCIVRAALNRKCVRVF
jgi:hypothetical protein